MTVTNDDNKSFEFTFTKTANISEFLSAICSFKKSEPVTF